MTTYADLRNRIYRLIGNPTGESLDSSLVMDAIAAAYDAILPWVPKTAITTIAGDGSATAFDLPSNFYIVDAVIVHATGVILPLAIFTTHGVFGTTAAPVNEWLLMPTGQLSFSKPLGLDEVYDLYYSAIWDKPTPETQDTDAIEPPSYLDYAMCIYAAAYIQMPDAVGVAGIGPYKTRVDSGNPEHNPLEKTITWMLNLFNTEMNRHPKHQRTT